MFFVYANCLCIQIIEEFPDTEIPPLDDFLEMTIGNDEDTTTSIPQTGNFDVKINEVMTILSKSKDGEITPTNFKSLLGSLIDSANRDSKSREEHTHNMNKVENLVNVFMKENAQRAQQNLKERMPKINPVLQHNKKVQAQVKGKYNNKEQ